MLIAQEMADDERAAQAGSGGERPDVGDPARAAHLAPGAWRQRRQRQLLGRRLDGREVEAHAEQPAQARQGHPADQRFDGSDDHHDVRRGQQVTRRRAQQSPRSAGEAHRWRPGSLGQQVAGAQVADERGHVGRRPARR